MVLDYVLSRPDVDWLATETDKLDLFADRVGVPRADLPQRTFPASSPDAPPTTRFLPHKLPVAVAGDPPVVYLASLVTDTTGRGLQQFLEDHAGLLSHLPAWTVIAVGPDASLRLADCGQVFGRFLASPSAARRAHLDDLRWYFARRRAVDDDDVSGLSVRDLDRYRRLRDRFSAKVFGRLYQRWLTGGDSVLLGAEAGGSGASVPSVGRLVIEPLPFDYSQFGSLPGVA
jgi:hypothetical protein